MAMAVAVLFAAGGHLQVNGCDCDKIVQDIVVMAVYG